MDLLKQQPILFFDSDCVLCSRVVTFILKHEKNPVLKFASLQGEVFQKLKTIHEISDGVDSTVLYENDTVYIESKAAMNLCKYLQAPFSFFTIFRIIPSFLLDKVYQWIARNRKNWFGTCSFIPGAGDRYLEKL